MKIWTWARSPPGAKYRLADAVYSQLLRKLQGSYAQTPAKLRSDALAFHRDLVRANHGETQPELAYLHPYVPAVPSAGMSSLP
jgi:hypothetical protein